MPQVRFPIPVPAQQPVCPAGSVEEPGYGCISSGYAADPDAYAPYLGAGFVGLQRRKLRRPANSIFRAPHQAGQVRISGHR